MVGATNKMKGGGTFLARGKYRRYNSGKYLCWTLICTKGFNSNELFQISSDYENENMHHR